MLHTSKKKYATLVPLLSPAGARVVTRNYFNRPATSPDVAVPAGARVVTRIISSERLCSGCCPPQGRELLQAARMSDIVRQTSLLSPAGARVVTINLDTMMKGVNVAVPRRGASCYGKNVKNTMRIFGIPTIFLYYLLYFCVSIRDIVGFLWCEPACNNLIYCYYNTRFAPNQPVLKPFSSERSVISLKDEDVRSSNFSVLRYFFVRSS